MPYKTGYTYTTGTIQQIASKFQRYKCEFFDAAGPNKVSPSDCDNHRQPEMAMWPPKPEILISLELLQIG